MLKDVNPWRVCSASRGFRGGHFACLRLRTVGSSVCTLNPVGAYCSFAGAKLRKNPETTMDLLNFSGRFASFFIKDNFNNLDRSSSARLQGKNSFCVFLIVVLVVLVVFISCTIAVKNSAFYYIFC